MEKYIRETGDTKEVAVLVSYGYGAGWSTWGGDNADLMLYDVELVQAVLAGKTKTELKEIADERYPNDYTGGVDGLTVEWVRQGTRFRINEYDGSESLEQLNVENYHLA